ncbi:MAG: aminotransferase class III-fold pyridoxal phosphate-dependent enzyme [Flavobacteriaceae bacterium]|nr:aminotransferase class III-fold pyridoxal phosphate-dependent enzyme [Flavobacteriaceae bacterium]
MDYQNLQITEPQASDIAKELFAIDGKAQALPGEIDFNFKIKTAQETYILKVSRPEEDLGYLDFQQQLLSQIEKQALDIGAPRVVPDKNGEMLSSYVDDFGKTRMVRCLSWVDGRIWSGVNPHGNQLRYSLGTTCGKLTTALQGFDHPQAHKAFEWDIAQGLWTKQHTNLFSPEELEIIQYFQNRFETNLSSYNRLRKAVVHNDANDNNLIVSEDLEHPKVLAAIDYGDALHTQIINDVAIAVAYAIAPFPDPLEASLPIVSGYHKEFALEDQELKHLYDAIAMRMVISVTKSAINRRKEPENTYLLISEKPAWKLLKAWRELHPNFAYYHFRAACGLEAVPEAKSFAVWAKKQQFALQDLFPETTQRKVYPLDLSAGSSWLGHQTEIDDLEVFDFKLAQLQKQYPNHTLAGGYLEPRPLYTADSYDKEGNYGPESRTVHLGVDFWLPIGTKVHALLDGEVVVAVNDAGNKEYGGLLILKHQENEITFYSLYGHLSVDSATKWQQGDKVLAGSYLASLGGAPENGNWSPHLHFQLFLDMLHYHDDFAGVAYVRQLAVWESLCPDPNLLFGLKGLETNPNEDTNKDLIQYRKQHLGKSLSLQYKVPIRMVRGAGVYLIDQYGNKYLDTVNNVAHVGHEHPAVVQAGQKQMALLNTNSRYLHPYINALAKELIATLPPELSVLHFVNSGSEANELAIRMVKAATGGSDIIASEVGYHGNTNMCIDISSYKFDGKGGSGAPEHTHIFPLPDTFRGKYREETAAEKYAAEVDRQIKNVQATGRKLGALILEPIISCGGQVMLPDGFLPKAYKSIRAAGGLCISDEVQVGCGRVGKTYWGFELYDVVPDIVTIGKPLGNGHPLAAVACTQEVADAFANGMEYFNTFGGNPVSCAIGTAVLQTVRKENLQENALEVGNHLKAGLKNLAEKFPIIGDVRGEGLFLGFELVDNNKNPLAKQTDYLANRMKNFGVLMSTDGPDKNVIKMKPPMVFSIEHANRVLRYLKKVLAEDVMTKY